MEASRRPPRGSICKPHPKLSRYMAREMPHKSKTFLPKYYEGNCYKCVRNAHFTRKCHAPLYLVNMYRELQQLRNQSCQNYNFDIPSLSNSGIQNYMAINGQTTLNLDMALLDSASTYTIPTNPNFLIYFSQEKSHIIKLLQWSEAKISNLGRVGQ